MANHLLFQVSRLTFFPGQPDSWLAGCPTLAIAGLSYFDFAHILAQNQTKNVERWHYGYCFKLLFQSIPTSSSSSSFRFDITFFECVFRFILFAETVNGRWCVPSVIDCPRQCSLSHT